MFCRNCGTQLNDGAKFCGKCGTAIVSAAPPVGSTQPAVPPPAPPPPPPKLCTSCGTELKEDWKICPSCGTVCGAAVQPEPETAAPPQYQPPSQPATPHYDTAAPAMNKIKPFIKPAVLGALFLLLFSLPFVKNTALIIIAPFLGAAAGVLCSVLCGRIRRHIRGTAKHFVHTITFAATGAVFTMIWSCIIYSFITDSSGGELISFMPFFIIIAIIGLIVDMVKDWPFWKKKVPVVIGVVGALVIIGLVVGFSQSDADKLAGQSYTQLGENGVEYEFTVITKKQFDRIRVSQENSAVSVLINFWDDAQRRMSAKVIKGTPPQFTGEDYFIIKQTPNPADRETWIRYSGDKCFMNILFFDREFNNTISLRQDFAEYKRLYNLYTSMVKNEK
jgi:RNA polymerase subunit RPABC4/transcription elongation factor Spt4